MYVGCPWAYIRDHRIAVSLFRSSEKLLFVSILQSTTCHGSLVFNVLGIATLSRDPEVYQKFKSLILCYSLYAFVETKVFHIK